MENRSYFFHIKKGEGRRSFVFIHGTGGDHTHMSPLFDHFSKQNIALNLDLRGHGKSEKPEGEYTIEGFAEDIYQLCKLEKIPHPILVGFSMGGNIGIELASRHPDFPSALVLLDSSFLYPESFLKVMHQYAADLKGTDEDFRRCIHQIVENGLLPKDRCKQYVEKSLLSTPQRVWASALGNMILWDKKTPERLKKCRLPILYIEAASRLVNLELFQELCPQLIHGKVIGSGHSISLEVPEQVIPMIDRFVEIYL